MFKWIRLIKWIKYHRKNGIASFNVVTNSTTLIITTDKKESNYMLRINF